LRRATSPPCCAQYGGFFVVVVNDLSRQDAKTAKKFKWRESEAVLALNGMSCKALCK
jgi:hypothetical protein